MHQPARAAVDQRQGGRDQRMVGRAEADLLGEREAQHHPRLANRREARCRVALSISASRSGIRRSASPAMATASAWSAGGRPRAACAAASSVCPRRSTASSICSAARRAPTPSTLGIGRPRTSSWRHETAQASRSARLSQPVAAGARARGR